MVILGIDPGTATTGYGIIKSQRPKGKGQKVMKCLEYGAIYTNAELPAPIRLRTIYLSTIRLITKWRPEAIAVESVYFFKNLKTAMPVSQAKGVILLAAAQKRLPVYEYTPLQVKSGVAGYGTAPKQQIQRMLQAIFQLPHLPKPDDAADALGVALCCFYSLVSKEK
jgi:crossover junction endodeoxyribonuclease RuvC